MEILLKRFDREDGLSIIIVVLVGVLRVWFCDVLFSKKYLIYDSSPLSYYFKNMVLFGMLFPCDVLFTIFRFLFL